MSNMYYYEVIFTNDESIAIRSLIPDMTVAEAQRFIETTDGKENILRMYGKVSSVGEISRKEVNSFFDDERIDEWPIAIRANQKYDETKGKYIKVDG